jgi:hypothetical protein
MQPMTTFDPDRPCRIHDRLNNRAFDWHIGWADKYRRYAVADKIDGKVSFDGLILDGWAPFGSPEGWACSPTERGGRSRRNPSARVPWMSPKPRA